MKSQFESAGPIFFLMPSTLEAAQCYGCIPTVVLRREYASWTLQLCHIEHLCPRKLLSGRCHDNITALPTIFVEKGALNMLFQPLPVFWDLGENFSVDCHLKNIWKDCRTTTEAARSCIRTLQKTSWYATRRSYVDSWSVSLVTSPCDTASMDPIVQKEHSLRFLLGVTFRQVFSKINYACSFISKRTKVCAYFYRVIRIIDFRRKNYSIMSKSGRNGFCWVFFSKSIHKNQPPMPKHRFLMFWNSQTLGCKG